MTPLAGPNLLPAGAPADTILAIRPVGLLVAVVIDEVTQVVGLITVADRARIIQLGLLKPGASPHSTAL
ncbi:hypothetical protein EV138_6285 [Kribbella voronezhensis]|uniref:Uncharacterized protein n=1 Tax=Kribbella voronezhensis TaxID=2512212 RepID=A0A4R7SX50_9ACTN|nr:hypothetical protein [Kribbella voronezhensis]TDU83821.1 hypothetical protein EV138_6285 [Kribbella voronezhensis]